MGILTDKPQDTEIDSKITAKLDRVDLNNEMAGIDTGKSWRFLSNNSPSNPHIRKKLETEREFRSMLDMLLAQDPYYAALYKKVTEKIDKAQQAVNYCAITRRNYRMELKYFSLITVALLSNTVNALSDEKAKNITFPKNAPK